MYANELKQKCPNFLYVGAGKAGSSWMFEILREHPQVFVPEAKDIKFFDRYYDKGMDWYLKHFSKCKGEKAIGELSHDYFLSSQFAFHIHQQLPDVKIIFCLREGVDRTLSEFLYDRTLFQFFSYEEYSRGLSFEEFSLNPAIVHRSDYYKNMKPFYDFFSRDQIIVFFFDDLKDSPPDFARRLYQFLEVDHHFQPKSLHHRVNVGREARSVFLARVAYKGGRFLQKMGYTNVTGSIKRHNWFETILYKPFDSKTAKPVIQKETFVALRKIYHKEYDKLSHLIGKSLPENWFER